MLIAPPPVTSKLRITLFLSPISNKPLYLFFIFYRDAENYLSEKKKKMNRFK